MDKRAVIHIIVVLIVSSCLYIITESFLMSLGILMILLLIDQLLIQYDSKRRREWEERQRKEREEEIENNNLWATQQHLKWKKSNNFLRVHMAYGPWRSLLSPVQEARINLMNYTIYLNSKLFLYSLIILILFKILKRK